MVLTKHYILKEVRHNKITIHPFNEAQLNPNSYNYRLGKSLKELVGYNKEGDKPIYKNIEIPEEGYTLKAKTLYLGNTYECIGSTDYMISLIGRSSIGRLGLFLQVSANVGHTGTIHHWTLELFPTQDVLVYPKMIVGQVSFWKNSGHISLYKGYFGNFNEPTPPK
ncbi:MAG: hypothetical protein MI974_17320 [Chitinophagales bacterium]|nr:hypothetical protein [Chitinophagales bacterium]